MQAHSRGGEAYEDLVGRVVSLCAPPISGLWAPGEPKMGYLAVDDTSIQSIGSFTKFNGRGFDADPGRLRAGAVCEAFERYGLMDTDDLRTRWASLAELERDAVPHVSPARLLALSEGETRQGDLHEIPSATQTIQWVDSADLNTGSTVLLPARYCIMFGHDPSNRSVDEGHWYCATSNGAATATSPTAACLAGLFELIERDAFMLLWYHRLEFPFLALDPASLVAQRLSAALVGCRLEYRLIDLTGVNDVPTVAAVVRGASAGDHQYGIGAAAARTTEEAAWKAAKEALAYYSLQRRVLLSGGYRTMREQEVRTFPDRPLYYMDAEHQPELEFLFAERPFRSASGTPLDELGGSPPDVLRTLVDRLSRRGIDLYAIDLTPTETDGLGMFTYRVVSPQMIPLDADHQARHLGHERLLNEPTRRGWRSDQPRLEQLNHAPHPFP